MAIGDITIFEQGSIQAVGAQKANVAAAATAILPGEPVAATLGGTTVTALATSKPVVGTDYMAGIATSTSTQTASLAGTVDYLPLIAGTTYLISPKVPASWNTQALYDALVGKRLLLDLTSGVYTINAVDGATSGCIVVPMDITRFPGKVAFKIRNGVSFLA